MAGQCRNLDTSFAATAGIRIGSNTCVTTQGLPNGSLYSRLLCRPRRVRPNRVQQMPHISAAPALGYSEDCRPREEETHAGGAVLRKAFHDRSRCSWTGRPYSPISDRHLTGAGTFHFKQGSQLTRAITVPDQQAAWATRSGDGWARCEVLHLDLEASRPKCCGDVPTEMTLVDMRRSLLEPQLWADRRDQQRNDRGRVNDGGWQRQRPLPSP